jgi:hypothetical protein
MSDGPHRSLPMRSGWKRVAERGANSAFSEDEINRAIIPALKQDCRNEMSPEFVTAICAEFQQQQQTSLFADDTVSSRIEALRPVAGSGIGRTFLDNVIHLSASDAAGLDVLAVALTTALKDRAARGARQVEEHYLRTSGGVGLVNPRARIEGAIASSPLQALAREILRIERGSPTGPPLRQIGLDDGVEL